MRNAMAIEKFIDNEVKGNDVVLFMKGTPQFPMCGFSGQVVQILDHLGVSYKGLNVLESDDLREGIKSYSNWPTIPQLYVKGEFVGGCDIIREMFQAGELQSLLKEKGVALKERAAPYGRCRGARRAAHTAATDCGPDPERKTVRAPAQRYRSALAITGPRLRADDGNLERTRGSARIELDHEVRLHLHGVGHVGELRDADELRRHFRVVDLDIVRHVALGQRDRLEYDRELLRLLLDLDQIADFDAIARDRDAPTVHLDVAVADELARGAHGGHQLGPVDHGVEPALEQPDHMGAGIALHADGFVIDAVELPLGNIAVIAPQLLLGAQLHAIIGELAFAALAVLAGAIFAAVDGALGAAPHILPHTAV